MNIPLSPAALLLLKWTLLLALVWSVHWLLRERHSRWRLILWRCALVFTLLLPLTAFVPLPALRIPIIAARKPAPTTAPVVPQELPTTTAKTASISSDTRPVASAVTAKVETRSSAVEPPARVKFSISWQQVLLMIWGAGVLLLITRLLRLQVQLGRLVQSSSPATPELAEQLRQIKVKLGMAGEIDLRISDSIRSPFACGLERRTIMLPRSLPGELGPDEISALLAHEVAHLRQHDLHWCVAWRWLHALLWWHPLVWSIPGAHMLACEQEADRMASGQFESRDSYGELLARLALRILALPAVETHLALNGSAQITQRLRHLKAPAAGPWQRAHSIAGLGLACVLFAGATGFEFTEQRALAAGQANAPAAAAVGFVIVTGTVRDKESGQPIADARVRAIAPKADLRTLRTSPEPEGLVESRTDANGRYELKLPLKAGVDAISLDALHPGHRSLAGAMMGGGDYKMWGLTITAGTTLEQDITLPATPYVAGVVTDEDGKPLAGVDAHASVVLTKSGSRVPFSTGWITKTPTDETGQFFIYDFPQESLPVLGKKPEDTMRGMLQFSRVDRLSTSVNDIYTMSDNERRNLKIVMKSGLTLEGTVVDASGNAAPNVSIHIFGRAGRRQTTTDAAGHFALKGIPPGGGTLYARSPELDQKVEQMMPMKESQSGIRVALSPTSQADTSKAVTLLGMKLIDVTPELMAKYDLRMTSGVLILDPGANHSRLGLGNLVTGNVFWMAGEKKITNLREFLTEVLRINELTENVINQGRKGSVRVVYHYSRHIYDGTNTQHLKLTDADVAELRQFLAKSE